MPNFCKGLVATSGVKYFWQVSITGRSGCGWWTACSQQRTGMLKLKHTSSSSSNAAKQSKQIQTKWCYAIQRPPQNTYTVFQSSQRKNHCDKIYSFSGGWIDPIIQIHLSHKGCKMVTLESSAEGCNANQYIDLKTRSTLMTGSWVINLSYLWENMGP